MRAHPEKGGGGLMNVHSPKSGTLGTSLVKRTEVAQKGAIGSLFITYIYVYLSI